MIASLTLRNPFQSRLQAMAPGDPGRVERVLAAARSFLAVSALVAIWIDPTEPSRYAPVAYGVMLVYAVHSIVVLVWIRRRRSFSASLLIILQGIDILWPAVMSVFTGPASSPFFLFDAFVLLEAAYRWGLQETLATGAIEVLLYFITSLLVVFGPTAFGSLLVGEPDVNRMIIRPLYLAIMAYLLGYLGEQEKLQRAETSSIARLIGRVQTEAGFRSAMRGVFEGALQVFGSNRTALVVSEKSTERVFIWEGTREGPGSPLAVGWSEVDDSIRSASWFAPPGSVWLIRQTDQGSGKSTVEVLEGESRGLRHVQWSPPAVLLARFSFNSALGVSLEAGGEWTGSWWLLDPDCGTQPRVAASYLRRLTSQLLPSLYGVFVMRRLRSQAGAMERARVARELHDGVIQALIGLEMQVDVLRRREGATSEQLSSELQRIQSVMHEEVVNLRELMQQMRPIDYNPKQFLDLLAQMVEKFRRDTGVEAYFVTSLSEVALPSRVGGEVARILQEALVNVRKHSGAKNVLVRFDAEDSLWKLAVHDDGCGYDFSGRLSQSELDQAGKGPLVIKERARSIGGEIAIESAPGRGTWLEVRFPQRKYG